MKIKKAFNKIGDFFLKKPVQLILRLLPAVLILFVGILSAVQGGIDVLKDNIVLYVIIAFLLFDSAYIAAAKPRFHKVLNFIVFAVVPAAVFFLVECMTHNPFDMGVGIMLYNIFLLFLAYFFIFFLTGSGRVSAIIVTVIPILMGLISYYTLEFRGSPLFPWDLASYGIAATVVSDYKIIITPVLAAVITAAVLMIQLSCTYPVIYSLRKKAKTKAKNRLKVIIRAVCFVLVTVLLVANFIYVQTDKAISDLGLYPYIFTPDYLYYHNGFGVSFLMNLRYSTVEKPKGYNADTLKSETQDKIYSDVDLEKYKDRPDIIVVMNESFADMKYLCDLETNIDYMPNINAMEKNTKKGKLHVSVVGGNTPNSEFEFLTGMTMGFLPAGSIAYQQFIKNDSSSYATLLKELGYSAVAMHPYGMAGWKRDTVYPMLGFDEMYFLNDEYRAFANADRLRGYVSDKGLYEVIEKRIDHKEEGENLFIFAVTMQNHGGYSDEYADLEQDVKVKGIEYYNSVSNYMSLVKKSDEAFKELCDYVDSLENDTILLMFGDHQPNASVANPIMSNAGMVYDESDIQGSESRYTVPYVIHSNFEMKEYDVPDEISVNYLATVLSDYAGLPKTYQQIFLEDLMEKYPVINMRCFIDSDGKLSPVAEYTDDKDLLTYARVQYNYLFDKGVNMEEFNSFIKQEKK